MSSFFRTPSSTRISPIFRCFFNASVSWSGETLFWERSISPSLPIDSGLEPSSPVPVTVNFASIVSMDLLVEEVNSWLETRSSSSKKLLIHRNSSSSMPIALSFLKSSSKPIRDFSKSSCTLRSTDVLLSICKPTARRGLTSSVWSSSSSM